MEPTALTSLPEAKKGHIGKSIAATGAGGIEHNVVAELNARGCDDLILVDSLGHKEKWRNLLGLRFEDTLDPDESLNRIKRDKLLELDAPIHLCACTSDIATWDNKEN